DPYYLRRPRDGTLFHKRSAGAEAGRWRNFPRRRYSRRHQGAAAIGRVLCGRLPGRADFTSPRRPGYAKDIMGELGVHLETCSNEASAAAMLGASINYP